MMVAARATSAWVLALALVGTGCGGDDAKAHQEPTSKPAAAGPITLTLNALSFEPGFRIDVRFDRALTPPAGQQYWITVAKAGAPDTDWGTWHYVPAGATTDSLTAPAAGAYEVRLHDLHPKYPARVIARQPISVVAGAGAPAPAPPAAAVQDPNLMAADGFPTIIPPPSSSPPSVEEWNAVTREVRVSGSSRLACKTKVLREWLSVSCDANAEMGVPEAVTFDSSSAQIYKFVRPGTRASLTAQLIDGTPLHATFSWRDPDGSFNQAELRVTWRGGRPTAWFDSPGGHD